MTTTQTMFGFATLSQNAAYDASVPAPGFAAAIAVGDALLNKKMERAIVTHVDENMDGAVFIVVRCADGVEAVWLQREVLAHIKR